MRTSIHRGRRNFCSQDLSALEAKSALDVSAHEPYSLCRPRRNSAHATTTVHTSHTLAITRWWADTPSSGGHTTSGMVDPIIWPEPFNLSALHDSLHGSRVLAVRMSGRVMPHHTGPAQKYGDPHAADGPLTLLSLWIYRCPGTYPKGWTGFCGSSRMLRCDSSRLLNSIS